MTERALEPLERQGWSVAHDLQGRYGNIDQLVVGPATGVRAWTQPVVVIWAPFPQQSVHEGGVVYVHGDHLAEWLLAQPPKLDQTKAGRIAQAIGS